MQQPNNEIWIRDKIKLVLEGNILYITVIGGIDAEVANETKIQHRKITENVKGQLNMMVDMNKSGKDSPEASNVWKDLCEEKDSYIAAYGLNPVSKVLASFFIAMTGNKRIRFFSTKEQGLEWLKEITEKQ